MVCENCRRFVYPNSHRRDEFPNPNRRSMCPNFVRDQGGGFSNLDEFSNSILSFDESHDVEFICFGSSELIICLT